MTSEGREVAYGSKTISYGLIRRRRKTVAISVLPNGSVEVVAPLHATPERVDALVKKRGRWVLANKAEFDRAPKSDRGPRYVSGATHRYLGRQYRLKVIRSIQAKVALHAGRIAVHTHRPTEPAVVRRQLEAWMNDRASRKFQERLEVCLERFAKPDAAKPTSLTVREIAKRWGSMTPRGRLVLNRRLIEAPIDCIDYVITHELCHRLVPNHSKHFWRTLTRAMPDWPTRKARLEDLAA